MRPVYVDAYSRDIGVYDTIRDRRTYSYTEEHEYTRACTYLVDSLPTYPPTNLPAATEYGTRIVMPFTKGGCDTLAREKWSS